MTPLRHQSYSSHLFPYKIFSLTWPSSPPCSLTAHSHWGNLLPYHYYVTALLQHWPVNITINWNFIVYVETDANHGWINILLSCHVEPVNINELSWNIKLYNYLVFLNRIQNGWQQLAKLHCLELSDIHEKQCFMATIDDRGHKGIKMNRGHITKWYNVGEVSSKVEKMYHILRQPKDPYRLILRWGQISQTFESVDIPENLDVVRNNINDPTPPGQSCFFKCCIPTSAIKYRHFSMHPPHLSTIPWKAFGDILSCISPISCHCTLMCKSLPNIQQFGNFATICITGTDHTTLTELFPSNKQDKMEQPEWIWVNQRGIHILTNPKHIEESDVNFRGSRCQIR